MRPRKILTIRVPFRWRCSPGSMMGRVKVPIPARSGGRRVVRRWKSCSNSSAPGCLKLKIWQLCGSTPDLTWRVVPSFPAASPPQKSAATHSGRTRSACLAASATPRRASPGVPCIVSSTRKGAARSSATAELDRFSVPNTEVCRTDFHRHSFGRVRRVRATAERSGGGWAALSRHHHGAVCPAAVVLFNAGRRSRRAAGSASGLDANVANRYHRPAPLPSWVPRTPPGRLGCFHPAHSL